MKIKKRTLKLSLLTMTVAIILAVAFKPGEIYTASDGLFRYSENRPSPEFEVLAVSDSGNYTLTDLTLQSRGAKLSAYHLKPKKNARAGIVLIPGAGVGKQPELSFAKMLAQEGFAVITFDQRGLGATAVEKITGEPEAHKAVYDALAAFDYLRETNGLNKVVLVGESLGGRTAIIAASMDERISAAVGISTSGYGHVPEPYYSINPDNYLSGISNRKIAFIHSASDDVIPVDIAKKTFQLAKNPKKFVEIEGCTHGYCEDMREEVLEVLGWALAN